MKKYLGLIVLVMLICQAPATRAQSSLADPHALRAMMSSLSKNLADMSAAMVPIADKLAARNQAKIIEHVLILNELLLIKTIIDYETKLSQTYRLIRNDVQVRYYRMRIEDMGKSKERISLALGRINRHTARITTSSQSGRQSADVNGLLAISNLTHTVEKVLVLFNMSIDYLKSAISPL
jgi:hypothetical protein